MERFDLIPTTTAVLILLVTVVSGPGVAIDLTAENEPGYTGGVAIGSGTTSVTIESVPTSVTLEQERFGASVYRLSVPPATVTVDRVRGKPLLTYKIRIPGLGHESGSATVLDPSRTGERTLTISDRNFDPGEVRQDAYHAELIVLTRDDGGKTVLHRANVTIEVGG